MTCCDSAPPDRPPRTGTCPVNGEEYGSVAYKTVLQHTRYPANQGLPEQVYYFCSSRNCDVVYFAGDRTLITRGDAREDIGQKREDSSAMLCYCFGITRQDVMNEVELSGASASRDFVIAQTRQGNCSCESRNPSGRCCLKDFPCRA